MGNKLPADVQDAAKWNPNDKERDATIYAGNVVTLLGALIKNVSSGCNYQSIELDYKSAVHHFDKLSEALGLKNQHPRIGWPLFVINKQTGTRHEVNKMVYTGVEEIHIWCNTWYGHHIIGSDCEWATEQHPRIEWVKASERLPMHKAFWLIEEGFKKDCTLPVRIDCKIYGMGEIFSDAEDGKSKFYFVIKGHSKDYYEDQFHRIEWLDESASPAAGREEDKRNEFVAILDNALDAGKKVLEKLKKENESQENFEIANSTANVTDVKNDMVGHEAVEFAKWATSNHWRWVEGLQTWKNPMQDVDQVTTTELYEQFKQKEK